MHCLNQPYDDFTAGLFYGVPEIPKLCRIRLDAAALPPPPFSTIDYYRTTEAIGAVKIRYIID